MRRWINSRVTLLVVSLGLVVATRAACAICMPFIIPYKNISIKYYNKQMNKDVNNKDLRGVACLMCRYQVYW